MKTIPAGLQRKVITQKLRRIKRKIGNYQSSIVHICNILFGKTNFIELFKATDDWALAFGR